tara:strand:+ start:263 stop:775 length:513 start_codon:yes stop_codon:yes gene_type:complete
MANGILKVGQITNSAGSGNITIGSGVTVNVNRPSFLANYLTAQSIPDATNTKVQFDSELFDTDSDYDVSTYKFLPTEAGKYLVCVKVKFSNAQDCRVFSMIYKNGAEYDRVEKYNNVSGADPDPFGATIIEMNGSTDYVEAYCRQDSGGALTLDNTITTRGYFYSYKLGV